MHCARIIHCAALLVGVTGTVAALAPAPARAATSDSETVHVHGRIVSVTNNTLTLKLRDGKEEKVDITAARAAHHTGVLPVGGAVIVYGTRDASGMLHAISIGHASPDSKDWTADD
jgi:hypothetical protein